jgi:tetratricopeptide (TPR) repeat protein
MRRALGLVLAAAVGAGALIVYGGQVRSDDARAARAVPSVAADSAAAVIDIARSRLKEHPGDARAWAELGTGYVERARSTADPTYYTKADQALRTALRLKPRVPEDRARAQIGMGTLANARHEFGQAEQWAEQAKKSDPENWMLYGVLADARLQLGERRQAEQALHRMMALRPGVAAYSRAAYYFALTGRPARATQALDLAIAAASPDELAFCHERRGELAWRQGQAHTALNEYQRALAVDPHHAAALAGRARAEAALGRTDDALRDYTASVERAPHPLVLLELGDFYTSLGRKPEAARQFALFKTIENLFRDSGVEDGVLSGRYEADHGNPATAVRLLRAEWHKAPNAETADALGWALHRNGQHTQALPYAEKATELDARRAEFAYHRGEIEQALGRPGPARVHLRLALQLNPHFSPLYAPKAKASLTR